MLMMLLNHVAFAPSLPITSGRHVQLPLNPLVTGHAIISLAWLLLFLTQATLIAKSRLNIHRRLGVFGAVLAVVFVVFGTNSRTAQCKGC